MSDIAPRLDWVALETLIADAEAGVRVHELMRIAFPGDLWHYAAVDPGASAEGLRKLLGYGARHSRHLPGVERLSCLELRRQGESIYWDDEPDRSLCEAWEIARRCLPARSDLLEQFGVVRAAQQRIRSSADPLVRYEMSLIDAGRHPGAFEPFNPRHPTRATAADPAYGVGFYERLAELLAQPEVTGASFSQGEDFAVVRLMAIEKLKRDGVESKVQSGFQIATVSDGAGDTSIAWLNLVHHYSEGMLRTGTLIFVGAESTLKAIIDFGPSSWKRILTPERLAAPDPRYDWQAGEGWMYGVLRT